MKDILKKEEGFTLLELIVVVAVIGILAAIVVPQIGNIQNDAQLSSVKASLSNIQTALEQYKLDNDRGNGQYPQATGNPGNWADVLGFDGTDYDYATNSQENYVVVYAPAGNTGLSIDEDGEVSGLPSNTENKINGEVYYITSEKSSVLTTTN